MIFLGLLPFQIPCAKPLFLGPPKKVAEVLSLTQACEFLVWLIGTLPADSRGRFLPSKTWGGTRSEENPLPKMFGQMMFASPLGIKL